MLLYSHSPLVFPCNVYGRESVRVHFGWLRKCCSHSVRTYDEHFCIAVCVRVCYMCVCDCDFWQCHRDIVETTHDGPSHTSFFKRAPRLFIRTACVFYPHLCSHRVCVWDRARYVCVWYEHTFWFSHTHIAIDAIFVTNRSMDVCSRFVRALQYCTHMKIYTYVRGRTQTHIQNTLMFVYDLYEMRPREFDIFKFHPIHLNSGLHEFEGWPTKYDV